MSDPLPLASAALLPGPGVPGRVASGAGLVKLLSASELRGLAEVYSQSQVDALIAGISTSSFVPYTGANASVLLGANALTASALTTRNGTSPTSIRVHNTYTSATSFETLDIRANAAQTAYEISSFVGTAGGTARPINIGHRNSAGTFTSALSVATSGVATLRELNFSASDSSQMIRALTSAGINEITVGKNGAYYAQLYGYYLGADADQYVSVRAIVHTGTVLSELRTTGVGVVSLLSASGLQIRNLANSANAALTCAAITASGTITGRASTTAAGTAPIKLPTGVLMTTPEAGAIEYDGTNLYFTDSGGTRRQLQVV
jgi:hypothetical protein